MDDYNKCQKQASRPNNLDTEASSFMWDHHTNKHMGDTTDPLNDFKWTILDRMQDPMTRQIREAVRIEESLNKGLVLTYEGYKKI